jgi:uncharacterized membrane protein YkvA (DUF1232 family)
VHWLWIGLAITVALYAALVLMLVALGRRAEARALATLVPDCVVLCRRLVADRRVSAWRRVSLVVLLAYLVSPIDLVPDFVPVAGQLDDAIIVALALRTVLRGAGPGLLTELWPGPERSLRLVRRLAGMPDPVSLVR